MARGVMSMGRTLKYMPEFIDIYKELATYEIHTIHDLMNTPLGTLIRIPGLLANWDLFIDLAVRCRDVAPMNEVSYQ